MSKPSLEEGRAFLQDRLRLQIDFRLTPQNRGLPPPPLQKPPHSDQDVMTLPGEESRQAFAGTDLLTAIGRRHSHRHFLAEPLSLAELALLLWATQGIREMIAPGTALRNVPSAGCRHAFETYLAVLRVSGLETGIYRYLPLDHALVLESSVPDLPDQLTAATLGQAFVGDAATVFLWTVLPYRMEWRYLEAAHRVIAMDVGHLCQNLYLACEAIGAGTCAIAAFHQERIDRLLDLDGEDEFGIYLAPVGKV